MILQKRQTNRKVEEMGQAKTMLRVRERKMAMRINAWMRDWRAGHSYRAEGPVEENQD